LALGMAFQIQDDLMDYQQYGQSGKPTGIDVKEQKNDPAADSCVERGLFE